MTQNILNKKLAIFVLRIGQDQEKEDALSKNLEKYGFCHGYALTFGFYVRTGRLKWINAALYHHLYGWDGMLLSLENMVLLPQDNAPILLKNLLYHLLNDVVIQQAGDFVKKNLLGGEKDFSQRSFLKPPTEAEKEEKFVLQLMYQNQTQSITTRRIIFPSTIDEGEDYKLFDPVLLEHSILLIRNENHVMYIGREGNKWLSFDSNSPLVHDDEYGDHTFVLHTDITSLWKEIHTQLGKKLSFEYLTFTKEDKAIIDSYVFPPFVKSIRPFQETGLYRLAEDKIQYANLLEITKKLPELPHTLLDELSVINSFGLNGFQAVIKYTCLLKEIIKIIVNEPPDEVSEKLATALFYQQTAPSTSKKTGLQVLLKYEKTYWPELIALLAELQLKKYNPRTEEILRKILTLKNTHDKTGLDILERYAPETISLFLKKLITSDEQILHFINDLILSRKKTRLLALAKYWPEKISLALETIASHQKAAHRLPHRLYKALIREGENNEKAFDLIIRYKNKEAFHALLDFFIKKSLNDEQHFLNFLGLALATDEGKEMLRTVLFAENAESHQLLQSYINYRPQFFSSLVKVLIQNKSNATKGFTSEMVIKALGHYTTANNSLTPNRFPAIRTISCENIAKVVSENNPKKRYELVKFFSKKNPKSFLTESYQTALKPKSKPKP